MRRLENPDGNPCFGCGPANPRGLGLTMYKDEQGGNEVVRAEHTPSEEEIGWPGFLHGGLHFLILYEASYWAALELGGRLMTAKGPLAFDEPITPRTGKPVIVRAWIHEGGDEQTVVRAESRGEDDRLLGTLEGAWSPVKKARIEQAGLDLPGYLWDAMEP